MPIPKETIREAAEMLYGAPDAVEGLARDLGVNPRNVQRMFAGSKVMGDEMGERLARLIARRLPGLPLDVRPESRKAA